jgi:hypothetical protein
MDRSPVSDRGMVTNAAWRRKSNRGGGSMGIEAGTLDKPLAMV